MMQPTSVIESIRAVARRVLPAGSQLYLYGSRARGEAREDSDWDLLVLLDAPIDWREREDLEFAFVEAGWDMAADFSPRTFTKQQWEQPPHTLFYFSVEDDKKLIYES